MNLPGTIGYSIKIGVNGGSFVLGERSSLVSRVLDLHSTLLCPVDQQDDDGQPTMSMTWEPVYRGVDCSALVIPTPAQPCLQVPIIMNVGHIQS